jgi:hypothetical protein
MKISEPVQNVLLALGAAALLGALFFLYDKTAAVDLRERNNVLGLLRELKETDVRWDVDVLRARIETESATAPGIDFDPVNGHRFIRFSFAVSTPEVEEALRRLTPWFAAQTLRAPDAP